ncbi:MAG: hypothetical protein ACYT04_72020, partial [Nostoc sp.]
MLQFHNYHSETLRVHEQYLQHQIEYGRHFFDRLQQEYSNLVVNTQKQQLVEFSQLPAKATASNGKHIANFESPTTGTTVDADEVWGNKKIEKLNNQETFTIADAVDTNEVWQDKKIEEWNNQETFTIGNTVDADEVWQDKNIEE